MAGSADGNAELWRHVSGLADSKGWHVAGLQLETGRLDEVFRDITSGERV
jgi:hypothetical protein